MAVTMDQYVKMFKDWWAVLPWNKHRQVPGTLHRLKENKIEKGPQAFPV